MLLVNQLCIMMCDDEQKKSWKLKNKSRFVNVIVNDCFYKYYFFIISYFLFN